MCQQRVFFLCVCVSPLLSTTNCGFNVTHSADIGAACRRPDPHCGAVRRFEIKLLPSFFFLFFYPRSHGKATNVTGKVHTGVFLFCSDRNVFCAEGKLQLHCLIRQRSSTGSGEPPSLYGAAEGLQSSAAATADSFALSRTPGF